jgi:hypothetical protein
MAGPPSTLITDLSRRVDQMARELASLRRPRAPLPEQFRLARVIGEETTSYTPAVTGTASKVRYWNVIPLDVVADAELRPTVNELTDNASRWTVRAIRSMDLAANDLVAIHQASDGGWWVLASPFAVARESDSHFLYGCDTSICLDEDSFFVADIECGACEKTPDFWVIESSHSIGRDDLGRFTSTSLNPCCLEQLYNPEEDEDWPVPPLPDGTPSRRQLLKRLEGDDCTWISRWMDCPEIDGTACGNVVYTWNEGTTTTTLNCTYQWSVRAVPCEDRSHTWVWDDVGGGAYVWTLLSSYCEGCGDVESPTFPSGPGSFPGQTTTTPCVPVDAYEWYLVSTPAVGCPTGSTCTGPGADPDGGSLGPPALPALPENSPQYFYCSVEVDVPGGGSWSAGTCACGSATAPDRDGAYDGETVVVPCSTGLDGYPAQYRWELTVDGEGSQLDLIRSDGIIVLGYRVHPGRAWCCLCTNSMLLASCGPFWAPACQPLTQLCLTPINPYSCAQQCTPETVEIEFECVDADDASWLYFPCPFSPEDPQPFLDMRPMLVSWLNDVWVLEPYLPSEDHPGCSYIYERVEPIPGLPFNPDFSCFWSESSLRIAIFVQLGATSTTMQVYAGRTGVSTYLLAEYYGTHEEGEGECTERTMTLVGETNPRGFPETITIPAPEVP